MSFRTLSRLWYITSTPSLARMTKPSRLPSGTSTVLAKPSRSVQNGRRGSMASTTSTGESWLSLNEGTGPPCTVSGWCGQAQDWVLDQERTRAGPRTSRGARLAHPHTQLGVPPERLGRLGHG